MSNMIIEGKRIYLRRMICEDMPFYREMLNDPKIAEKVVGHSEPVTIEQQLQWFERVKDDENNQRLTIVLKDSDVPVGMVTLTSIDRYNCSATHGIKLHSDCPKGEGIGTDAVMTLMEYAFEILNLHRLNGGCIDNNIESQKLYDKCGWTVEGIKKEAIFRDGYYHDMQVTGILKSDYLKVKKKLGW